MTLTVVTNNAPRETMCFSDFSVKDQVKLREKFDWMDENEIEETYSFFKYKGEILHLSEFMNVNYSCPTELKGWDGYLTDTYFSGLVVRLVSDNEEVVVGRFYS
jgi:hypothetical protein